MFTRRTIIGLLAATTMMGSASFAVAQEKPYIALVSKGFQHQFWQAVKIGAEQAAEEFDVTVTFEGPDGEGAVDRQLDMISAAMAKKPSALGIAAIDSQATVPLLKRAQKDGIPVIAFDSGVASDIPVATASTDNLASAALAADKLAELIGGSGKVAIVSFDQTSQNMAAVTISSQLKSPKPCCRPIRTSRVFSEQMRGRQSVLRLARRNPARMLS